MQTMPSETECQVSKEGAPFGLGHDLSFGSGLGVVGKQLFRAYGAGVSLISLLREVVGHCFVDGYIAAVKAATPSSK